MEEDDSVFYIHAHALLYKYTQLCTHAHRFVLHSYKFTNELLVLTDDPQSDPLSVSIRQQALGLAGVLVSFLWTETVVKLQERPGPRRERHPIKLSSRCFMTAHHVAHRDTSREEMSFHQAACCCTGRNAAQRSSKTTMKTRCFRL